MTAPRTDARAIESESSSTVEIPYAERMPSTIQDSMTLDFEEDPEVAAGVRQMIATDLENEHARVIHSS